MPVIEIGAVGHILATFAEYASSLLDPLFDGGERLPALIVITDKTEAGHRLQVIGSKGLQLQFLGHAGRGKDKTVNMLTVPDGLVPGQVDPLTFGFYQTTEDGEIVRNKDGSPRIDRKLAANFAPKAPRTRRKKDPNTGDMLTAEQWAERYPEGADAAEETEE